MIKTRLGLLIFACVARLAAAEPNFDPFAPTEKSFSESLPEARKPAGREVRVQLLEVREKGRADPWPSEPPQEWLQGSERGLITLRTSLNVEAEIQRLKRIEKDPAGKNLAESFSTGTDFACRPDETDEPGVYLLHFLYTRDILKGWLEEPKGTFTPLRSSHSYKSRIQLNNRWFLFGVAEAGRAMDDAAEKAEAAALYLRIDDGLPPAKRPVAIQSPTSVAPAP